eukprot:TRINITY_DN78156_c0_g1_i1.p1 TRINITY_DN78156_c0_g1~~TRINITY_DN78156_c0_g1_i1.p1  ORF type:complete len:448 (-),score=82.40 TRINITY_DN78156_c0_g1_i1:276-1619(-)
MDLGSSCGEFAFVARGWSVRRGFRKRLLAPKRGKAAARAAAKGQGTEVQRGRAVFKRSVNCSNRFRDPSLERNRFQRRMQLRRTALIDACEAMEEGDDYWSEGSESEDFQDIWLSSEDSLEIVSTCPSTAASTCEIQHDGQSPWKDLHKRHAHPTPWEAALARAALIAELFAASQPATLPVRMRQRRWPRRSACGELKALKDKLLQHNAHLVHCGFPGTSPFDTLRWDFLKKHVDEFGSRLRTLSQQSFTLRPTPLSQEVQKKFLEACSGELEGELRPGFHGTDEKNLESIYRRGLLVPGDRNDVKVVNGSAHGRGIYTAKMHNPMLSWGFSRGSTRPMLLCGILDDAVTKMLPEYCGYRLVTAESDTVRHVGDAVVIFDSRRVAPLFSATFRVAPLFSPRPLASLAPRMTSKKPETAKVRKKSSSLSLGKVEAFLARRAACKRRDS